MKIKILSLIFSILLIQTITSAETLDKISTPKRPAYRLGLNYNIEKEYKITDLTQKEEEIKASYKKDYIKNMSYADSSLKDISNEITKLLEIDRNVILEDIQILWMGAAKKSETIKFALYKLSNPEADKPDETIVKKIIRPLATASSIAGAGIASPLGATSAIVTSHLLNSLSFSDKDLNYKYTKVSDADMVVLMNKIEALQTRIINEYFDYMAYYNLLLIIENNLNRRQLLYEKTSILDSNKLIIADAFYRSALDKKTQYEMEFLSKRAALEQLVGNEALREFESVLFERTKQEGT